VQDEGESNLHERGGGKGEMEQENRESTVTANIAHFAHPLSPSLVPPFSRGGLGRWGVSSIEHIHGVSTESGWEVMMSNSSSSGEGRCKSGDSVSFDKEPRARCGNSADGERGEHDVWVPGVFDVLVSIFPHRRALVSKLNFLRNREDAIVRRYTKMGTEV